MNITRLEPYNLLGLLNRDLGRFERRLFATTASNTTKNATWVPAVDILEEDDQFLLRADLPGIAPEDIDLRAEKGVLILSGERQSSPSESTKGLRRAERFSGKFSRRFSLPDTADTDNISAQSRNGILEVTIPKLPELQQRRISVEAA